jgi:hypothetical protein
MSLDGFVADPSSESDWIWIGKPDPAGCRLPLLMTLLPGFPLAYL